MKGEHSDDEMNEELNDKLNELWTGAAEKRRELIRNKTPSYSRRTDLSEINASMHPLPDSNLLKIRQKLASEVSAGKHKELEIENLRRMVSQLTNDKKALIE
ncbi:unnamed protein product [Sphagnum balticum]